jgi:hypothetical protein
VGAACRVEYSTGTDAAAGSSCIPAGVVLLSLRGGSAAETPPPLLANPAPCPPLIPPGTSLRYKPGFVAGGGLGMEHDCGTSRGIGYFLEPLALIALWGKKPLTITLRGITNDSTDCGVDVWRTTTFPLMRQLTGADDGFELKVRGLVGRQAGRWGCVDRSAEQPPASAAAESHRLPPSPLHAAGGAARCAPAGRRRGGCAPACREAAASCELGG